MEWTYQIRAAARPRTLMRLAQIFDQQVLAMQRCLLEQFDDQLEVSITIQADEALAQQIHTKLYKLQDVLHIELHCGRPCSQAAGAVPSEDYVASNSAKDPKASPTAAA